MNKQSLLIIQGKIPAYRVPFFESLSKYYELSVLHFFSENEPTESQSFKTILYNKPIKRIGSFYYTPGIFEISKKFEYVIVMFDIWWIHLLFLTLSHKKKQGSKLLLWGHGLGRTNNYSIATLIRKIVAKKADAILFYSTEGKKIFCSTTGIDKKKCFVAPNSIYISNSKNTSGFQKNSFLFVGRIQKRKKLNLLLEAFSTMNFTEKPIMLNIIGDGEEKKQLIDEVEKLQISKQVKFINSTTDNNDLLNYFEGAYAYVSPGAVGLGLLHSYAYGVPVISMKDDKHGPEISDLINNKTGYLTNNFDELCNAMQNIVNTHIELGNNAYKFYTEKRQIESMTNGFLEALNYVNENFN